jgi:ABC-type transporter Mla subunit MlaD
MANLEVAADELVRKLKSVEDEVNEAHERFATLSGQVSALGDQVDQDWAALAGAVAELVEKAKAEEETLARETQESAQALATLDSTAQRAQEAASTGLEAAENGTTQLGDAIRQHVPAVESVSEAGERSFQALGEQAEAIGSQIEQVLQEGRDFLTNEMAAELEAMRDDVAERFAEMRTTLVEECAGALQTAYDDWSAKLDEVVQTIEQDGFQAARENAEEVVSWAITECTTAHEEEFNRLLELAEVVRGALRTLKDDVGECATDVGEEGGQALEQALAETQQALVAMIGALDGCRQVMTSYSFVDM